MDKHVDVYFGVFPVTQVSVNSEVRGDANGYLRLMKTSPRWQKKSLFFGCPGIVPPNNVQNIRALEGAVVTDTRYKLSKTLQEKIL